ncbi:MAG TPA: rhodanese-like domain-containing protein [Caldimonas sp.]|nr:rhodanese-like domain-containing protein [Caldimonas sp.]
MRELTGPDAVALAAAQAAQASPLVLLDVREPWEVAVAAIDLPGAATRSMPMREVPARLAELDPAQPVVCFCHHGARSAQVVAFLERAGFASAYNLAGGIDAWSRDVDPRIARY